MYMDTYVHAYTYMHVHVCTYKHSKLKLTNACRCTAV